MRTEIPRLLCNNKYILSEYAAPTERRPSTYIMGWEQLCSAALNRLKHQKDMFFSSFCGLEREPWEAHLLQRLKFPIFFPHALL